MSWEFRSIDWFNIRPWRQKRYLSANSLKFCQAIWRQILNYSALHSDHCKNLMHHSLRMLHSSILFNINNTWKSHFVLILGVCTITMRKFYLLLKGYHSLNYFLYLLLQCLRRMVAFLIVVLVRVIWSLQYSIQFTGNLNRLKQQNKIQLKETRFPNLVMFLRRSRIGCSVLHCLLKLRPQIQTYGIVSFHG
jgi:hypothetical protein